MGLLKKSVYLDNTGFYHRIIDDMEFSSRLNSTIKIKTINNLIFKHSYSNLQKNIIKLFFVLEGVQQQVSNHNMIKLIQFY